MKLRGVVLSLVGLLAVPALAGPTLQLAEERVTVAALTPGGAVALVMVGRRPVEFTSLLERRAELVTDADGDGQVELLLDAPPTTVSVWVAVDLTTGLFQVASPEGYRSPELAVSEAAFGGSGDHLEIARRYLDLLLVRPGRTAAGAAWYGVAGDGAPSDADGLSDRRLRVAADSLGGLVESADSPPPEAPTEFADGDVLVLIDPETLAVAVTSVVVGGGVSL